MSFHFYIYLKRGTFSKEAIADAFKPSNVEPQIGSLPSMNKG